MLLVQFRLILFAQMGSGFGILCRFAFQGRRERKNDQCVCQHCGVSPDVCAAKVVIHHGENVWKVSVVFGG